MRYPSTEKLVALGLEARRRDQEHPRFIVALGIEAMHRDKRPRMIDAVLWATVGIVFAMVLLG